MIETGEISAVRRFVGERRRAGASIGLVPTMGYLHAGHLELVRQAKKTCAAVVVSIFVNPLQFAPHEDFARYPRDLDHDRRLLAEAGVDLFFAPEVGEMYPRPMETHVDFDRLGLLHEGAARPGHFRGVATVVTKLFNIVQPDRAFFGEKDYQQLTLIRRMVEDLAVPVEIVGVPTVRENDGLARSSRNIYLDAGERQQAVVLSRALRAAETAVAEGLAGTAELERVIRAELAKAPLAVPDLVVICEADTLEPAGEVLPARIAVMLAVRFGRTRLIDQRVIPRPKD